MLQTNQVMVQSNRVMLRPNPVMMGMKTVEKMKLVDRLDDFILRFTKVNREYIYKHMLSPELEGLLDEYTKFILSSENQKCWDDTIHLDDSEIYARVVRLRDESAYAVCIFEKYTARQFITMDVFDGKYLNSVGASVSAEFDELQITKRSKVLMIGAGSIPTTVLLLGKLTGAKVLGLDIDEEALYYAKKIIGKLGAGLDIDVTLERFDKAAFTREATHIIIASVIPEKYDILEQLYPLTNQNVTVAMRYGNGIKSLFNYPGQASLQAPWKNKGDIHFANNVFDETIYTK